MTPDRCRQCGGDPCACARQQAFPVPATQHNYAESAAGWAPVVVPETLSEAQQTPLSPVDAQQASLTWTDHRPPDATIPYDHVIADTPLGSIWIEWKSWKESPSYTSDMPWTHFIVESSLSDAKVKVQELWDRKISELVGADIASQRVEAPQLDIAAIQGEAFERAKKDVMKLYGAATYEDGMQLKRAAEAMAVSPGSRVVVIPAEKDARASLEFDLQVKVSLAMKPHIPTVPLRLRHALAEAAVSAALRALTEGEKP